MLKWVSHPSPFIVGVPSIARQQCVSHVWERVSHACPATGVRVPCMGVGARVPCMFLTWFLTWVSHLSEVGVPCIGGGYPMHRMPCIGGGCPMHRKVGVPFIRRGGCPIHRVPSIALYRRSPIHRVTAVRVPCMCVGARVLCMFLTWFLTWVSHLSEVGVPCIVRWVSHSSVEVGVPFIVHRPHS